LTAIPVDPHIVLRVRVAPDGTSDRAIATGARRGSFSLCRRRHALENRDPDGARPRRSDDRLLDIPDGFDLLPNRPEHCKALIPLRKLHRDPSDRILIAGRGSKTCRS
jgi:hypothetical protein